MLRRTVLASLTAVGTVTIAGCSSSREHRPSRRFATEGDDSSPFDSIRDVELLKKSEIPREIQGNPIQSRADNSIGMTWQTNNGWHISSDISYFESVLRSKSIFPLYSDEDAETHKLNIAVQSIVAEEPVTRVEFRDANVIGSVTWYVEDETASPYDSFT